MKKHPLELIKEARGDGLVEFCNWLGISHNTYKKIINHNIGNTIYVEPLIKINKKTGLDVSRLLPNNPINKLIKK